MTNVRFCILKYPESRARTRCWRGNCWWWRAKMRSCSEDSVRFPSLCQLTTQCVVHLNVEVEPNAGRIWFKKPPLVCFILTSAYFWKWISRYFTPPPNNIYFSSARAFKLRFFFPSATRKLHGQRNWCGEQLSAPCKRYEGLCLLHALIIVAFWTTFALFC